VSGGQEGLLGHGSGESFGPEPFPGFLGAKEKWEKELHYFVSSVADGEDIWKMLTALGAFSNSRFEAVIFPRW